MIDYHFSSREVFFETQPQIPACLHGEKRHDHLFKIVKLSAEELGNLSFVAVFFEQAGDSVSGQAVT